MKLTGTRYREHKCISNYLTIITNRVLFYKKHRLQTSYTNYISNGTTTIILALKIAREYGLEVNIGLMVIRYQ